MQSKTTVTPAANTVSTAADLKGLVERARDYASEAVFVPSGGNLREAFVRLAHAELVLLEKEINADFVSAGDLERKLADLERTDTGEAGPEPKPESKAAAPQNLDARPRCWWMPNWFFMRKKRAGAPPIPASLVLCIDECRRQITDARLREATHQQFVKDRLALLEAEFDVQFNRAAAAKDIAAVMRPAVEVVPKDKAADTTPLERKAEDDANHNFLQ